MCRIQSSALVIQAKPPSPVAESKEKVFISFPVPLDRHRLIPTTVATLLLRGVNPLLRHAPLLARPFSSPPSSLSTVPRLSQHLASHYHSLDPDLPLPVHERTASQELKWLEQHARKEGYGSGNWQTRLNEMVQSIIKDHKPLAYILGSQPFYPLPKDLLVRPPILVPRPETEHWVLHLSQTILSSTSSSSPIQESKYRILDIGTGSGCIALGLSYSLLHPPTTTSTLQEKKIETFGIDQSPNAVELARENATRCELEGTVRINEMDLFDETFVEEVRRLGITEEGEGDGEGYDLVVSNPPYITREEFKGLDPSVKDWEDRKALVGERSNEIKEEEGVKGEGEEEEGKDDGLIFYRRITSILDSLLSKTSKEGSGEVSRGKGTGPPNVAFEVGMGQAEEVAKMLRIRGYKAEIVSDPWGVERAVFGWKR